MVVYKALSGLGLTYISDPDLYGHQGQVCFLSPESKVNMEKQQLVFMHHLSSNNCMSAETLSSFNSRLKMLLFAAAFY